MTDMGREKPLVTLKEQNSEIILEKFSSLKCQSLYAHEYANFKYLYLYSRTMFLFHLKSDFQV